MTLHEKLQAERAEGIEQEKIATVIRMAKKNMPLSDIAECTDLSTDEVQKILALQNWMRCQEIDFQIT